MPSPIPVRILASPQDSLPAEMAAIYVGATGPKGDPGADGTAATDALAATLGTAALLNVGTTTGTVAAGDDARFTDPRAPTGAAGGVLSGTYPNPGFVVDMATQDELDAVAAAKVDKITGKGLSTEDYSTAEKSKLAGIAPGATANATDAQLRDRTTHTGAQAISTVTGLQTALDARVLNTAIGATNGVASLDAGGKVPAGQLPSYVDDVLEASSLAAFPATGETGKIYVALDTNKVYRWTGSVYIEISPTAGNADTATKLATARTISATGDAAWSVSFDGSGNVTAAMTLAASGATAGTYKSVTVDAKGRVTGGTNPTLTKTDVGLGNVDNTADSAKPVSTAQAAAIAVATAIHPFLLIGA